MSFNPVSGRVGFVVTGLNETIRGTDGIIRDLPQSKMNILRDAAVFFVTDARANVHKITHKTERSTKVESVTPQGAIVSSGFGAPFEEKKAGSKDGTPHKFMTAAAQRTGQQFPIFIKKRFDELLNRHKTR